MIRFRFVGALSALAAGQAGAQLVGTIGPEARGTSMGRAGWQASAQLSSSLRFDAPWATLTLDDAIERRNGALSLTAGALNLTTASRAVGGLRVIAASAVERNRALPDARDARSASAMLSYRYVHSGAWLGYAAERFSTPSMIMGLWRQIGSTTQIAVTNRLRRLEFGGRPASVRTIHYFDSTYTDTGGVQFFPRSREVVDPGAPAQRVSWAETEGRVAWALGRVALDGVVGFRPRVDSNSSRTMWAQGFATVALARNVALSVGAGTLTTQLPYVRGAGRFGSVAVRFAPAALVRPNAPMPITPAAAAFAVKQNEAGEYVISIRVPRARVVELSGDFNSWRPLRLEQVRANVWEVALPIKPGTYRMNLRIDGERWIAPPGTTAVNDEFNGQVGLVIVR